MLVKAIRTASISPIRRAYASSTGRVFMTEGKRTPFGKFGGSLMDIAPNALAIHASKAALAAAKIDPTLIDHVIYANVVPSTTDTIYGARHTGLGVGTRIETPAYTVNRLCGSGIQAISDARHLILRGEAECVLVAGSENMSMIPHLTYGTRFGTRFNSFQVVDMLMESLNDKYCNTPMAITAETLGAKYEISRASVDEYTLKSHQKATKAYADNHLAGEIAPVEVKKATVSKDEHIRSDANLADMTKLKAIFKKDGLVTAATGSGIVDGAAAVLVVSEIFAKKHGLNVIAEVGESVAVGVDPAIMGIGPAPAIRQLLKKIGKEQKEIDLFEINEAFAAQVLAVAKELNLSLDKLNIWGGATAIGHPLGATGVRITNTLARQLKSTGKKTGIASACIGGGQGIAIHITSV
jgi:acetyl-CoA C-acetyltransferase/acetyl-CoA acyltransferase 2